MKVLVTGGRTFRDRAWLFAGLDLLNSMSTITEIIEGGAPGADTLAANWAIWKKDRTGLPKLTAVPAQWDLHGKGAGFIRNGEMAKMRPDVVLACPGGNGTDHMVRTAQAHGLKVVMLERMPVIRSNYGGPVAETPIIVVDAA
jgi:hypothetical protein